MQFGWQSAPLSLILGSKKGPQITVYHSRLRMWVACNHVRPGCQTQLAVVAGAPHCIWCLQRHLTVNVCIRFGMQMGWWAVGVAVHARSAVYNRICAVGACSLHLCGSGCCSNCDLYWAWRCHVCNLRVAFGNAQHLWFLRLLAHHRWLSECAHHVECGLESGLPLSTSSSTSSTSVPVDNNKGVF